MYLPKQIPQLLNQNYRNHINYLEFHEKQFQPYIMCIWKMTSKHTLVEPITNTVLPDGCIDLIVDFKSREIIFTGFSKNTEDVVLEGDVDFIGIRFKPGAIYCLFNVAAGQVMNHTILFHEIEKKENLDSIFATNNTQLQIDVLMRYLATKIDKSKDMQLLSFVDTLYHTPTSKCVSDIGELLGYGTRQLQRVFLKNYGVTPRVLLNILRLHKCLTLLFDHSKSLQDIAMESGFYDQAHFIKEIKRYTGILPTTLLTEYTQ